MIATVSLRDGGRVGICRIPGRSGDLGGDIAAIRVWAPHVVVSMTGADEMAAHGSAGLVRSLEAVGIVWRHFPVADFGVPEGPAIAAWPALAKPLHAALDAGAGVLLHCHGGLGRSGMVALRLLTERGEDAETALARIRQARPGAVETEAQRVWGAEPNSPR